MRDRWPVAAFPLPRPRARSRESPRRKDASRSPVWWCQEPAVAPEFALAPASNPVPRSLFPAGFRSWGGLSLLLVRHNAECGRKIDLVILFLLDDLAQYLAERIFTESICLPDAFAVIANRVVLCLKIQTQHPLVVF